MAKPEKKQEVTLLDPKRSNNINIVLARFRKTNEAIRDAVMALDETVLNEENCSMLVKSLPDAEELEIINSFDGDPTTLGKSEKFFVVIKEVPDVVNRCTLFLFKLRFAEQTTEIGSKLKVPLYALLVHLNCDVFPLTHPIPLSLAKVFSKCSETSRCQKFWQPSSPWAII